MTTIQEAQIQYKNQLKAMRDKANEDSKYVVVYFAVRLQKYMDDNHITLSELALTTGISRGYLHEVRNGNGECTIPRFWILCRLMGVKPSDMLPPIEDTE